MGSNICESSTIGFEAVRRSVFFKNLHSKEFNNINIQCVKEEDNLHDFRKKGIILIS